MVGIVGCSTIRVLDATQTQHVSPTNGRQKDTWETAFFPLSFFASSQDNLSKTSIYGCAINYLKRYSLVDNNLVSKDLVSRWSFCTTKSINASCCQPYLQIISSLPRLCVYVLICVFWIKVIQQSAISSRILDDEEEEEDDDEINPMAFLVDGAKLVCGFSPAHYFRNRISIYSSHRKLGKCFNKTRRARNLVIFSCSDHKEEGKKSSFPHKPVFVSLVLRLFHYIRLCYSSYRRSRFLLRPYSCSCLALLVSTTVRRGFFSASPFLSSLIEALTMVFMSELGDKSMFATALLATRYRPWLVFLGAMIALTMMTGIACFLGNVSDPRYVFSQ